MTTPKLHTSDDDVNFRYAIASGAVHRTGILPPWADNKRNVRYFLSKGAYTTAIILASPKAALK